jgi:hypothetical protein
MPSPAIERMVGKSGYIRVIDDATGQRVKIPFVSWVATTTTTFVDRTSSTNYSQSSRILFRSSRPVMRSMTVDIVGRYRRSTTPSQVVSRLFGNTDPFHVELGLTPLDPYVDFYAFIENFSPVVKMDDVIDFTCTLRSEGVINNLTNPANARPRDDQPDDEGGAK